MSDGREVYEDEYEGMYKYEFMEEVENESVIDYSELGVKTLLLKR